MNVRTFFFFGLRFTGIRPYLSCGALNTGMLRIGNEEASVGGPVMMVLLSCVCFAGVLFGSAIQFRFLKRMDVLVIGRFLLALDVGLSK